jgi:hypothetical protein
VSCILQNISTTTFVSFIITLLTVTIYNQWLHFNKEFLVTHWIVLISYLMLINSASAVTHKRRAVLTSMWWCRPFGFTKAHHKTRIYRIGRILVCNNSASVSFCVLACEQFSYKNHSYIKIFFITLTHFKIRVLLLYSNCSYVSL